MAYVKGCWHISEDKSKLQVRLEISKRLPENIPSPCTWQILILRYNEWTDVAGVKISIFTFDQVKLLDKEIQEVIEYFKKAIATPVVRLFDLKTNYDEPKFNKNGAEIVEFKPIMKMTNMHADCNQSLSRRGTSVSRIHVVRILLDQSISVTIKLYAWLCRTILLLYSREVK